MIRPIEYTEWISSTYTDQEHSKKNNGKHCSISSEVSLSPIEITREVVDMVAVAKDSYSEGYKHESCEELHTEVSKR